MRSLEAEGIEYVFGHPGDAVLGIYNAIPQPSKFKHILVRHEQAAVRTADAYARVSGKVGVTLVASGLGTTNVLTGIATAYSDSIPLVVIAGQTGTPSIGTDALQKMDTVGISHLCVRRNFFVTDVDELTVTLRRAFQITVSGRPGPAIIDVSKDVTRAITKFSYP